MFPLPSWEMLNCFYTNLSYKHSVSLQTQDWMWINCLHDNINIDYLWREIKKLKTSDKQEGLLQFTNNQYQGWSMEVLKVLGLKNFKYETGVKTPQSRRNLQASRLKLLHTAACPAPLLRTTHRLKNIVKSEHKSLAPEACFSLPHQEGSVNGQ